MKTIPWVTALCMLLVMLLTGCFIMGRHATKREELGRSEKMRVLVDKVLMRANGWVMSEDIVRQIAEAGFNVVSPRLGGDDMERVRQVSEFAEKYGIYHMPWMRGTLTATEGTKLVWADGTEQDLYSPNSDELWEWMTRVIVNYAKISTEVPSLIGVFLDYENYAPKSHGNAYSLSYDQKIMSEFTTAKGIELPDLALTERATWLKERGLHDEFEEFQISQWRKRCRTLRKAVDEINPRFQFCVYPAPGTLFMREAIWREWGTEQAPLILADASTYGRRSGFLPHAEALEGNRRTLTERMESVRDAGIPFIYIGGIDPIVRGADPEFSAKNAVMLSEISNGYWVFYEGPTYGQPDHDAYWKWFTWANTAIAEGRFEAQHEPRKTPDEWGLTTLERKTDKPQIALYGMKPRMFEMIEEAGKFEVHDLRGNTLEYLRQFDVIVLQNFNVALRADSPFSQALREYVHEGGGLLLAHDTAWFMESPFPEIAMRDKPTQKVEAERHVVDTPLQIVQAHEALGGLEVGTTFSTEFRDHMIFKAGPQGTVISKNLFGDPVYVVGTYGKGRVAFSGCYYGYTRKLEGEEKDIFFSLLDWLSGR